MTSISSLKNEELPVALDAMGGDHGSLVVIEGALDAARKYGISSILVGDQQEIREQLKSSGGDKEPLIQVKHASQIITMDDAPSRAVRAKADSSIRVAFELVKDKVASAVVSPGNTGAVMAAGMLVSGNLPGIVRPAIASLIPRVGDTRPTVFLDCGANVDCHAYQLVQFAIMGDFYSRSALSCKKPRVALLSNGTETSKGNDIIRSAAVILSEISEMNFIGFVEGRDLARDVADVVVCDGFIGNIVLKTMEGGVELVFDSIRHYIETSGKGKLGMWLVRPMFKTIFAKKLDPSAHGGAPLLGLNDIAIVCHGSAKRRSIMNGIRAARKFCEKSLVEQLGQALISLDSIMPEEFEDGMWRRMEQRFDKGAWRGKKRGRFGISKKAAGMQDKDTWEKLI